MEVSNYARLSDGLKIYRDSTLKFICEELRRAHGYLHWWDQGVVKHLGLAELDGLKTLFERRHERLTVLPIQASELHEMLDVNHFRQIIAGNWGQVFEKTLRSRRILDWIQEVTDARNQWAHPGPGEVREADANRVLDTCARITELFDKECSRRLENLRDIRISIVRPPIDDPGSVPRPSGADERHKIRELFHRVIRERGDPKFEIEDTNLTFTHFAPLSWDDVIPKRGTRPSGRVLSYLIENRPNSLRLFLEICPGEPSIRARIFEAAKASALLRPPNQLSPQWCRIFRSDILGATDYAHLDIDGIHRRIAADFDDFCNTTFKEIEVVIQGLEFS